MKKTQKINKTYQTGERKKMIQETNGGSLKTYRVPCLKEGACDEVKEWDELIDIEEIGYRNGIMYVRCMKCGYEQHSEGIIPTQEEN